MTHPTIKKGDTVRFQDELFTVHFATTLDVLMYNKERRMIVHPLTVEKVSK